MICQIKSNLKTRICQIDVLLVLLKNYKSRAIENSTLGIGDFKIQCISSD